MDFDQSIMSVFEENFTYYDYLEKVKANAFSTFDKATQAELFHILDTNYDVITDENAPICERVIFPNAAGESMGMEDVRFVAFTENEKTRYIGTYTAYNGYKISPQLIITDDFVHFRARSMYGDAVSDKGMALFPEKIDGKYVMIDISDHCCYGQCTLCKVMYYGIEHSDGHCGICRHGEGGLNAKSYWEPTETAYELQRLQYQIYELRMLIKDANKGMEEKAGT